MRFYLIAVICEVVGAVRTMFLRPVIKVFSRFFHKKSSSTKRLRNPSTFQECMDIPEQSGGYWKPALFILLLLPTIYYLFYFRGYAKTIDPFNESFVVNDQQAVTESVTGDIIILHKKYEENKAKVPETTTLRPRKPYVDLDGLPLCAAITVTEAETENYLSRKDISYASTNVSNEKIAQDLEIRLGGHYVPKDCRPRHKVAILVPYWWNRKKNLKLFLYYIHPFLIRQRLEYRIFVVEQHGDTAFNKGRLFNAGFLEIQKNDNWQCVIFHDVDLLPADIRIRYTCPVLPRHMCAAVVGKENIVKYNTVFSGVTAMTMWHYKKANGYSNKYWGRGESEDMFKRLQAAGLGVTRYKKSIAKYISLKHAYSPDNPDRIKLLVTAEARYKTEGLSTLRYNVASYASFSLYTHIVVNVNNFKKPPDYITEMSVTLSP